MVHVCMHACSSTGSNSCWILMRDESNNAAFSEDAVIQRNFPKVAP